MREFFYKERGIYYRKNEFKTENPTVIFVHGLSGSSSAWLPYEKRFEGKYNILSLDLRGHGKSMRFPKYGDYEINKIADDMNALVDYLSIDKFIFVSHSLGTLVVFDFLTQHLEKVTSAIFLSPNYSVKMGFLSNLVRLLLWPLPLLDLFPFTEKTGIHVDYTKYKYAPDWHFGRMYKDISNTYLRVYLYHVRQLFDVDYKDFMEKIKIPILIIHGKKDSVFPFKKSVEIAEKIENSEIVLIQDGNHLAIFNNFKEVCDGIENFVDKNFFNKQN